MIPLIANIVMAVIVRVKGLLVLNIGWVVLAVGLGTIIPFGYTLAFVILKLMGRLALGWGWIVFPIISDCVRVYGANMDSDSY